MSSTPDQLSFNLPPPAEGSRPPPPAPMGAPPPPSGPFIPASLAEEAQRRYLTYALSVITSRALPDVRDGLKPVQRRILYSMWNELHLRSEAKYRKCALIVGDVMGKFHPHGDSAIYDALARMAQAFTMRAPLVDGRGNFGSPDGDAPAAMRYTEARLQKLADELLTEIGKKTVAFRQNYDNTRFEPIVVPARFPNLLVNGSQGIAVGMATSIPPHNFGEVVDACLAMIDDPKLGLDGVLKHVKGPDFPSGGQLLSTRKELREVYATGQGSLKLRGTWKEETTKKGIPLVVITSIPYSVERRTIVEKVAEVIIEKKLPLLLDVRDESTNDTRIVLELKKGADAQLVMAYLFKHTPLLTNVQVNLTCLVPTENPEVCAPERLDLERMLRHFLDFRMDVVTKRLEFELGELRRRLHILEGFEKIFDILDEVIRIIRKSDGKADAAEKLMKRFLLDEEQVDAILELKLYRLAKLEILLIQKELDEKRREAARIEKLLASEKARWKLIRAELEELKSQYPQKRDTKVTAAGEDLEYDAEAFIVEEDALVLLSEQGWVKRQGTVKDLAATRVREGDSLLAVVAGSTKSCVAFFSNLGACYVLRINDVPASTGYGNPVQTLFKLEDKERIIAMLSFDPRVLSVPPASEGAEPEPPYAVAVSRGGMSLRFSLRAHAEPSTRAGRRYMRLDAADEVMFVSVAFGEGKIACATVEGHALACETDEISLLAGPGKGVTLIKLQGEDRVVGVALLGPENPYLVLEHDSGKTFDVGVRGNHVVARGGKGAVLFKRGHIVRAQKPDLVLPVLEVPGGKGRDGD